MAEADASAAPQRARLIAAARSAAIGRGAGLRGDAPSFSQLCEPPAWLSAPEADRTRIGGLAALLTIAPRLARSVDGRVFAPLADAFGDDALERALQADAVEAASETPADVVSLMKAGRTISADAVRGDVEAVRLMSLAADMLSVEKTDTDEEDAA